MGNILSRFCTSGHPKSVELPVTDIVSYAFDRQAVYDAETKKLFINAEDPSQFLTANQTTTLVRQLIAGLHAAGLQKGDAVLLHLANHYLYAALFFAIIGAGGIVCGANPAYQSFELNHIVDLSRPRFLITSDSTASLALVQQVCTKQGIPLSRIFTLPSSAGHHPLELEVAAHQDSTRAGPNTANPDPPIGRPLASLLRHGETTWMTLSSASEMRATTACYYSTSGTTGLPKLAALSHHALVAQQTVLPTHNMPTRTPAAETIRLAALPLFHVFGAAWALLATVRHGQPVYVVPRFSLLPFLAHVARYKISETYVAPPVVHALNRLDDAATKTQLSSLRYIGVGGAPIDAVALRRLRSQLHADATVSQVWGMTEFGVATVFRAGENDDTGSIGRLLDTYEMRLVGEDGREVVVGEGRVGELWIRTPGAMSGYLRHEMSSSNEGVAEAGWVRTGDTVHVEAGKLYVTGRAKELIKVRGWHVAPAEIEAVLLQHPDVADCAVVGTASADGGEVPRAYVVRQTTRPGAEKATKSPISAQDVFDFARRQLASYKKLDGGVVFVDRIPRTTSGKTQRFKLAQMGPTEGAASCAV
ncbi:hypothetical protein B0T22DRAFT_420653 [Podospora appendiculata]|uniref:4-coumarate--CoA ligase n=1 Tax=Podospora appendiculata TaxID=314037 RepID=A0AAE1CGE6_9PEZI|nr:hypothetical protein B0T22DRAFT_420653 [Podospora appendiculata]